MVEIEEVEPADGDSCEELGELELEDNPGEDDQELELEENPQDDGHDSSDGAPLLEDNSGGGNAAGGDEEDEADEDEWEIPFASDEQSLPAEDIVDVCLMRKGDERLGLVLDAQNMIVALREGTPAAACGELFVGDRVLAVQGVLCSPERRVAQLLRELPDTAAYVFRVSRELDAAPQQLSEAVSEHGPLMTPEEAAEHAERDLETRHRLRGQLHRLAGDDPARKALEEQLAPRDLRESRYVSERTEMSKEARRQMQGMWFRQARSGLASRLSAAEMLKDEGNDKFGAGQYSEALEEYEYALQLFAYEMANLCRDQEEAELGDHRRGLGSDDLPAIQKLRVPCLLNSAACHIKLGSTEDLTKALQCCAEVVQAAPPAAQRAKAHFRMGQAHHGLENFREAWAALVIAQELNPSSREVRSLQAKVSFELKQLKVAERESREGLIGTELNHKQLFKREKASYAAKIQMLRKLLPPIGSEEEARMVREAVTRSRAEALLERAASVGWTRLGGEEQMKFAALWSAAQPRLGASEIRDGRDAGVFPPRDEERIFGQNLPHALMAKPFPPRLCWLTAGQKQRARGLAITIWKNGVEDLDGGERRLCEGLELLATGAHTAPWHQKPIGGGGGAQLILSHARRPRWPFLPPTLRVQEAVMGVQMPHSELSAINRWSRRPMAPGEVGIIQSNCECWKHALGQGWEWTLVLEDDARVELAGGALQLLALLPELVASARELEPSWQLLLLTPHGLEPFYDICNPRDVPSLHGEAAPAWARRPKILGDSGWKRVGPSFHAFGWIYRSDLMRALLGAYEKCAPPLNPVDVWVWEVMALNGMLGRALAVTTPLVNTNDTPGGETSLRGPNVMY